MFLFMILLLIASALFAFLAAYILTPWFVKFLKSIGLTVKDMNKVKKPLVPLSGGIPVLIAFILGILFYVFFAVFFNGGMENFQDNLAPLFAGMISLFMITLVGFIDDLIIKKDKSESAGMNRWLKPILTLLAAVPLMVVSAGVHVMNLPIIGVVDFGWVYPLILIPIGVVGASNMVNLLAGLNGLEAGLGLIYTGMLSIYAYVHGSHIAALIALVLFGALLAFWIFNKVPAKIFPGDSLTYLLGGSLAVIAIVGNIEKAVIIVSIPFFIEVILKIRGKVDKASYGYEKDGKIYSFYKKVYSMTHIFMNKGYSERKIVYLLMFVELIFASLMWLV
jgi:UDP-N-acetylglucosamine--dolichyl-phosphate N-acetylglucosaminephosphotransferase